MFISYYLLSIFIIVRLLDEIIVYCYNLLLLNRMRHGTSLQIIKIFCLEFVIDLFI